MIQHFPETTKLFTQKSSAKTNHLSAQILRHFMGFYSLICPLVNFFVGFKWCGQYVKERCCKFNALSLRFSAFCLNPRFLTSP